MRAKIREEKKWWKERAHGVIWIQTVNARNSLIAVKIRGFRIWGDCGRGEKRSFPVFRTLGEMGNKKASKGAGEKKGAAKSARGSGRLSAAKMQSAAAAEKKEAPVGNARCAFNRRT